MAISLYDPSTQSIQKLHVEATFEVTTAAVEDAPSELSALRKAVLSDVLRRTLPAREYRADPALDRSLEVFARGALHDACEGESLRLWLLEAHYRAPLRLAESADATGTPRYPALDESERRLAHLYATLRRLGELPVERVVPVQTAPNDALVTIADALYDALGNDLDSPEALRVLDGFLSEVNALCDAALRKRGRVNRSAVDAAEAGFATLSRLLGLGAEDPVRFLLRVRTRRAKQQRVDVTVVERKVLERSAARAARDFERADRLQVELLSLGVSLLDGPAGTTWTLA
jgi:cysteinyl-tRNA synthetase